MAEMVELTINVDATMILGETARIAATVVLPPPHRLRNPSIVCFAKPAGSYSRAYFTDHLPGPLAEAQAEWHAKRGWIFVALDNPGTGDSSRHPMEALNLPAICAITHIAEQEILLRLANGVVSADFPPVIQPVRIGLGHSLGGCLTIMQQAHHATYDGIAVLGYGVLRNHIPTPPGEPPLVSPWFSRDIPADRPGGLLNRAAVRASMETNPGQSSWAALRWSSYFDDVSDEVVEMDLSHYKSSLSTGQMDEPAKQPWAAEGAAGSAARSMLTPGIVLPEASAISVPVLIAVGERDFAVDPPTEPQAYRSACSIDLFVCPKMGHMHNFATTRSLLWSRIGAFGDWCGMVTAR